MGTIPFSRGSFPSRDWTRGPALEADSLLLEPLHVCMRAQSCPALCNPTNCRPPGSSVHGILQARRLEWVAIPLSRGSSLTQGSSPGILHCRQILYHLSHYMLACMLSGVWLFVTPWTVAHQASLSVEFSRQEYWSGLPFPPPWDLPDSGTEWIHVSCNGRQILFYFILFTTEPPGLSY